jgi:hypothetical protein
MHKRKIPRFLCAIALGILFIVPQPSFAKEVAQQWELINPSGVIEVTFFKPALRLSSLDGKTIVLRWNEKHNGDNFPQQDCRTS